jgi:hypothetical protein
MREIRAGSGLGDSIYLQSIVRHLRMSGKDIIVRSNYPDVFRPLNVSVTQHRKDGKPIVAHYVTRKHTPGTSQFEDMCIMAGIKEPVQMQLDWRVQNTSLLTGIERPIIAVMLPRAPMDRSDGFGSELMPKWEILQNLVNLVECTTVQVGAGKAVYNYSGIDVDLANKTSISDLIDVASMVDGFIGTCSFMLPLAESLGKPFFALWSSRGLKSRTAYISSVTPEKAIHRKDLGRYAIDSSPWESIESAFRVFLRQASCREGSGR